MFVCVSVHHKCFLVNTAEVVIIKLGTVTASDARMHHVSLLFFTLISIQGHTNLHHESNTFSIISKAGNPTYDLHNICQSDDLDLHSRSQLGI